MINPKKLSPAQNDDVLVEIEIPENLRTKLQALCEEHDIDMQTVILSLLVREQGKGDTSS